MTDHSLLMDETLHAFFFYGVFSGFPSSNFLSECLGFLRLLPFGCCLSLNWCLHGVLRPDEHGVWLLFCRHCALITPTENGIGTKGRR